MTIKRLTGNVLLTGSGMGFFQLGNFLLAILIARFSGAEAMGSFQLFVVTTTFFSYFAKVGFDEKLVYNLPKIKGGVSSEEGLHEAGYALRFSFLGSVFAAFGVIVFYVGLNHFSEDKTASSVSFFALLFLPAFVCGLIFNSIFRAEQKIRERTLFTYFLPVLLNIFFYLMIFLVESLSGVAAIVSRVLAYSIVSLLAFYYLNKKYAIWNAFKGSISGFKRKSSLNLSWLTISVTTFLIESGTLLIWAVKANLTIEMLGIFAVLLRLASLVLVVPSAIGVVVAPYFAKQSNNMDKQQYVAFIVNAGLTIMAALAIVVLAPYLLMFFGGEYVAYMDIMPKLLIAVVLFAITQPLQVIALANSKVDLVVCVNGLSLVASLLVLFSIDMVRLSHAVDMMLYIAIATSLIRMSFLFRKWSR